MKIDIKIMKLIFNLFASVSLILSLLHSIINKLMNENGCCVDYLVDYHDRSYEVALVGGDFSFVKKNSSELLSYKGI